MTIRALTLIAATLLAGGALAQSGGGSPRSAADKQTTPRDEPRARTSPASRPPRPQEGRIKSFECGDNCYLTLVDARGREVTGLCAARACDPWNARTQMPRNLVGKSVRYTTGAGAQRDAAGNVMGRMTSFRTIEIVN